MKRLPAIFLTLIALACLGEAGTTPHEAIVSSSNLFFGTQTVGTTSTPQMVTLTNIGSNTISIDSVSATGGFSQNNDCGSLAPSAQCNVAVLFTPAVEGTFSGSVTIYEREGSNTDTVALTGTAVAVPATTNSPATPTNAPVLSSSSLDFGSQTVGTPSASQTVTLTNSGTSTITIDSVTASGDYSQSNNCASLSPGAQCAIAAFFNPTIAGTISGSLTIAEGSTTQTVALTGTGATVNITHSAQLNWATSASTDVIGYNVYRSTTPGGGYAMLNSGPLTGTSYMDSNVTSGTSYYYVCTAVTSTGLESAYSNEAAAAIP